MNKYWNWAEISARKNAVGSRFWKCGNFGPCVLKTRKGRPLVLYKLAGSRKKNPFLKGPFFFVHILHMSKSVIFAKKREKCGRQNAFRARGRHRLFYRLIYARGIGVSSGPLKGKILIAGTTLGKIISHQILSARKIKKNIFHVALT